MCYIKLQVKTFNLEATLECGQCFRWEKQSDMTYIGVIEDRVLKVLMEGKLLHVWSNKEENIEQVVKRYFDLDKNYTIIEKNISKIDDSINKALNFSTGIHILNQPLFETIISYIISANNNIKRISRSVNEISKKFGKKITFEGKNYYLFPTPEELRSAHIDDLLSCGARVQGKIYKTYYRGN